MFRNSRINLCYGSFTKWPLYNDFVYLEWAVCPTRECLGRCHSSMKWAFHKCLRSFSFFFALDLIISTELPMCFTELPMCSRIVICSMILFFMFPWAHSFAFMFLRQYLMIYKAHETKVYYRKKFTSLRNQYDHDLNFLSWLLHVPNGCESQYIKPKKHLFGPYMLHATAQTEQSRSMCKREWTEKAKKCIGRSDA